MNQSTLPRLGAACGTVFAIVLTVANGNGTQTFSGPRAIAGITALTLGLPFIAYLCSVLREAARTDGWLASTALAAGITGIALNRFSPGVFFRPTGALPNPTVSYSPSQL